MVGLCFIGILCWWVVRVLAFCGLLCGVVDDVVTAGSGMLIVLVRMVFCVFCGCSLIVNFLFVRWWFDVLVFTYEFGVAGDFYCLSFV